MSSNALKISLYTAVLNLVFVPWSSLIAAFFGYCTIIFFVLYMLYPMLRSGKLNINKTVVGFVIAILISFVTSLGSLHFSGVGEVVDAVIAVVSFVVFYWALSVPVREDSTIVIEDVFTANYILAATFVVYSFGPFDFKYQIINEYGGKIFTIGLGNPNAVAMCVMFSIIVLLLQFAISEKRSIKIINNVLLVLLTYILFLLSSRTVFFCVLMIFVFFMIKSDKLVKVISRVAIYAPVVMIFFHLGIKNADFTFQIFGKSLDTGRYEMYTDVIDMIRENPVKLFFGNICDSWFYNTHNGMLTVLATLGLVGVILYVIFWNQQFELLRNICTEKHQKIAFTALIAFIIHASSESMAVIGTIPYGIFVLIIMRIAKGEIKSKYDGITEDRA